MGVVLLAACVGALQGASPAEGAPAAAEASGAPGSGIPGESTVALPPIPQEAARIEAPALFRSSAGKIVDRPDPGPSLGGFVFWTFVVMLLLGGAFILLRRLSRRSRFLGGGGVIQVLARRSLGPRQEVFLVESGPKVFLIGSTRDRLVTLGEFSNPDDVAALRASLPARERESQRAVFRTSLREGIREAERPPSEDPYVPIAEELSEIRKTVSSWRA